MPGIFAPVHQESVRGKSVKLASVVTSSAQASSLAVEASTASEDAWAEEVTTLASFTLFPRTDSWWTGANIPGKPRYFSAYLGGSIYYQRIADVAAQDYDGFVFEKSHDAA